MIKELIKIAEKAGKETLKYYNKDYEIEYKEDKSPLTEADKAANEIIVNSLKENFPEIPVISEESEKDSFESRKGWSKCFLVDPIDGTKEFIAKNGEFTINIAYVEGGITKLGVVFAPAIGDIYYSDGKKSYKNGEEIFTRTSGETLTIVASRSHINEDTKKFIEDLNKPYVLVSKGSSLKICLVAEGKADIYPRLGPCMEWDTAAAHAILKTAGGNMNNYNNRKELLYNKENLKNPFFVAQPL